MNNIRKGNNNDDSTNQNQLQNINSIGSISKKSTKRQMTRPLLNTKASQIPRLNELLNDHIFQFYYRTFLKSKEYHKFKYYNEIEKINFLIDLYFYVMEQADLNEEENDEHENNEENENNEGTNKLIENLIILDNNQSRMNVIEKMKEYKLFDLNWENSYTERFNQIMSKYKFSGGSNNYNNEETINYYKTDKNRESNNIYINNENNPNYGNINYKSRPLYQTKANIKTNNNESNLTQNYEDSKIENNLTEGTYYKSILLMNRLPSIYDKINITNIKMVKMGKLRVKKINDNINLNEYEIKSKKNDIVINNDEEYKILKPRINTKLKNNISPLLLNDDNEEIIIKEPKVISGTNVDKIKHNLILKKQVNENETNELIKKIYQFEGDNISFNKNEINKIGIMILNYIRLEKKYDTIETSLFIYKDKINKLKEKIQILSKKALERINDSNNFIKEQTIKN